MALGILFLNKIKFYDNILKQNENMNGVIYTVKNCIIVIFISNCKIFMFFKRNLEEQYKNIKPKTVIYVNINSLIVFTQTKE